MAKIVTRLSLSLSVPSLLRCRIWPIGLPVLYPLSLRGLTEAWIASERRRTRDRPSPTPRRCLIRIAILTHEGQTLPERGPLVQELAHLWKRRGHRVTVLRGVRRYVDADILFLHVDLTRTPRVYLRFASHYPVVVNGAVTDISKRRVSRNLVTRNSGWRGPVLVKTDRNYGGWPERRLAWEDGLARRALAGLRQRLPWSFRSFLKRYPIFDSIDDVPRVIWANPDLVVEKFQPEVRDGRYWVRTWLFLGDEDRAARFWSDDPIVKGGNILGNERLEEIPEDLRSLRRELGFDFGKFDFAVVDGRTVLYDANRTPALGAVDSDEARPWLERLADGLASFSSTGSEAVHDAKLDF